ncbi:MAG: cytochrome P460 family protein [Lentisphaeraceae bacterium]|nr:cytochrome P460 family protein [Lentisphaeraceae bacterium]
MKYIYILTFICFASFLPSLVSEEGKKKEELISQLKQEGEEPFKSKSEFQFPKDIQKLTKDYRKNWTRLTNYEFSGLHWKQFIVIYVNKEPLNYVKNYIEYGRMYLDEDEDEEDEDEEDEDEESNFIKYPTGTIFLKEHFFSNKGKPNIPMSTTLMIKREAGFDPENGDWEYMQYTKEGIETMRGKADNPVIKINCSDCHKNMAERDYVFATHSILDLKEDNKK